MQAILTKYLPATDTKGSRIKASCERGSITIDYSHELGAYDTHRAAVEALTARFAAEDSKKYGSDPMENPWKRPFVTGHLPSGDFAHVFFK